MTTRFHLAGPADAEPIAQLSNLLIESGLPWSWTEDRVRHHIRSSSSNVIVSRVGRRIIGFAIMDFYDEHAHLSLLAVIPSRRRRGTGRGLIEWLEASARAAGVFTIRLELRSGNIGARKFYERLGYRPDGIRPAYYAGIEDALKMRRDLSVHAARRA